VTTDTRRVMIHREPDVATAVMAVREFAKQAGLGVPALSALATAVSELATNIIKYAERGQATFRSLQRGYRRGVEVIVEDRGPGIEDLQTAMKDHVSTGGSLGLGLPGSKRLVDEFEISSVPGRGTRIRLVKWA